MDIHGWKLEIYLYNIMSYKQFLQQFKHNAPMSPNELAKHVGNTLTLNKNVLNKIEQKVENKSKSSKNQLGLNSKKYNNYFKKNHFFTLRNNFNEHVADNNSKHDFVLSSPYAITYLIARYNKIKQAFLQQNKSITEENYDNEHFSRELLPFILSSLLYFGDKSAILLPNDILKKLLPEEYHKNKKRIAKTLKQSRNYVKAENAYINAIRENSTNYELYYGLGTVLEKQKKYDEALKQYKEALSFIPPNQPHITRLIEKAKNKIKLKSK